MMGRSLQKTVEALAALIRSHRKRLTLRHLEELKYEIRKLWLCMLNSSEVEGVEVRDLATRDLK